MVLTLDVAPGRLDICASALCLYWLFVRDGRYRFFTQTPSRWVVRRDQTQTDKAIPATRTFLGSSESERTYVERTTSVIDRRAMIHHHLYGDVLSRSMYALSFSFCRLLEVHWLVLPCWTRLFVGRDACGDALAGLGGGNGLFSFNSYFAQNTQTQSPIYIASVPGTKTPHNPPNPPQPKPNTHHQPQPTHPPPSTQILAHLNPPRPQIPITLRPSATLITCTTLATSASVLIKSCAPIPAPLAAV